MSRWTLSSSPHAKSLPDKGLCPSALCCGALYFRYKTSAIFCYIWLKIMNKIINIWWNLGTKKIWLRLWKHHLSHFTDVRHRVIRKFPGVQWTPVSWVTVVCVWPSTPIPRSSWTFAFSQESCATSFILMVHSNFIAKRYLLHLQVPPRAVTEHHSLMSSAGEQAGRKKGSCHHEAVCQWTSTHICQVLVNLSPSFLPVLQATETTVSKQTLAECDENNIKQHKKQYATKKDVLMSDSNWNLKMAARQTR